MDDALVQDDGIDSPGIGPMLGGHARPSQGVRDREGSLRDPDRPQDGNYLRVSLRTERAQLSTAGQCAGNSIASGDQGVRDTTRRETHGKQLRQGGDVDRWQLRL